MRKFNFSVIYIENDKLKHKQIKAYSAAEAFEEWKMSFPNTVPLSAGLGTVNKEYWKTIKEHEEEIVKENNRR